MSTRTRMAMLAAIVSLFGAYTGYATTSTTAPVIAAAGDITCAPGSSGYTGTSSDKCQFRKTAVLLAGTRAVLPLGDNQYDSGQLTAYDRAYANAWGQYLTRTRPVPGNHEYQTSGARGYFGYFGSHAGTIGKGYYSYNIGAWHLIALNSEISHGAGSAQEVWLKHDLATHTNACTLAYWHRPRFSSGEHGNQRDVTALWRDLYAAHADIVLNGHDHDYERFAPQTPDGSASATGIREFVVGTGGKSHYSFHSRQRNSQVRNNTTFGVLKLTLRAASYDWRFVPIAGSSWTDSGTARCVI